MDMENGQSSSSSSAAAVTMVTSTQKNQVTKLVRVRKGVETQIKLVQEFLEQPSENTICFLKTIAAIIKRSKEQQNIHKNVTIGQSVPSDSNSIEASEVEQLKKFVNSVQGAVDTFTILKDEERDENLATILNSINWITQSGKSSVLNGSEETSSSKNTHYHGNLNDSDSKRQKVTLDAESNAEEVELFTTEKNPLEIDVILKNLYTYIGKNQLFSCRLVSRKWNSFATTSLKQSDYFLKFSYDSIKKTYIKFKSPSKTLSQLNSTLSTTKDSPFVNFKFTYGDLGSLEAQEFFKTYGGKIKRLSLALSNEGKENMPHTSITTFRRILLEYAKNTEWLDLFDVPIEWCEDSAVELFPEPKNTIQLPKITTLQFRNPTFTSEKSYRLAQDLIQAAVNLKRIRAYKIGFLDPSLSAVENKIHAVKFIRFEPTQENLHLYSKFAEGQPKLKYMDCCLEILHNNNNNNNNNLQLRKKVIETLQMILEFSKDTLKSMSDLPPLSHVPGLKFPSMKKMNDISFTDHKESTTFNWIEDFQGIPRPPQLHQILPTLRYVTLKFQSAKYSDLWLNFFDYSQPLHSVKRLEVEYELCPRFGEKLALLFPAVEKLELFMDLDDFRQTMPVIWKGFSKVTDLTVEIYKYGEDQFQKEEMDSGITGFSPETCLQLRMNSRKVKLEDVEALRENPSICDATKLSYFKIQFQFEQEEDVFTEPIFSIVTGIFGFDLVKKRNGVKVECGVAGSTERKLDIALAEITHYISVSNK